MDNNNNLMGYDDYIENESSFILLPEGNYEFTVRNVIRGEYSGSSGKIPAGCKMVTAELEVVGKEGATTINENFYLMKTLEWKISAFYLSIGMKKHGEKTQMQWDKVVGKKGKALIIVDSYKNKDGEDRENNKIKKFYAYDEDVQTVSTKSWTAGAF